jgi:hypothetical protein
MIGVSYLACRGHHAIAAMPIQLEKQTFKASAASVMQPYTTQSLRELPLK